VTVLAWVSQPDILPWAALILGLAVGSFLNVVIHRLPKIMEREWHEQCAELRGEPRSESPHAGLGIATPRSRCPACGHGITALENIPLVSYLVLRGRCSACGARISLRYPAVELVSGMAAAFCAWKFGATLGVLGALGAMVFVWVIIAASFIDFDTQYLPDSMTLPLLWLGLLINIGGTFADLRSAVIGAAAGYLALWSIYWAFKLATGKEGMGFGDFKLLAAIGAWLGWSALPIVILLSSLVGSVVGIGLIVFARHGRDVPIPFGPYLGAAGIIALFWGTPLTNLIWSRLA
jgi:leader peptidase (prepilin peptidase)/N-methyltransferase